MRRQALSGQTDVESCTQVRWWDILRHTDLSSPTNVLAFCSICVDSIALLLFCADVTPWSDATGKQTPTFMGRNSRRLGSRWAICVGLFVCFFEGTPGSFWAGKKAIAEWLSRLVELGHSKAHIDLYSRC